MARQRHRRLVLEGSEHDGTLGSGRDDDIEGSPRVVHDCSCHILVCGGYRDPDHDAVCASAASSKRRPILTYGMQAMESARAPPPRTVIGDLSQTVPTGSETFNLLERPPLQCAERDTPSGTRHLSRVPQGDEQLARQATSSSCAGVRVLVRTRNHLASALSFWNLRSAMPIKSFPAAPLHYQIGEPLFPTFLSALIRRTGQAPVARHSAPVAQVS